eukprot:635834-Amphidinium_carterae.2
MTQLGVQHVSMVHQELSIVPKGSWHTTNIRSSIWCWRHLSVFVSSHVGSNGNDAGLTSILRPMLACRRVCERDVAQ